MKNVGKFPYAGVLRDGKRFETESNFSHFAPSEKRQPNFGPDEHLIRMRPYLGRYEDSMARVCFIAERDDVIAYIRCYFPQKPVEVHGLTQRAFSIDVRNGWNSWLISLFGTPLLWTDKPVPGITQLPPIHTGIRLSN